MKIFKNLSLLDYLILFFLALILSSFIYFNKNNNYENDLCTYENLTYSYLNYATKEVTYNNSNTPIYEKCKYIYIS